MAPKGPALEGTSRTGHPKCRTLTLNKRAKVVLYCAADTVLRSAKGKATRHLMHLGICTSDDFAQYPNGITPDAAEQQLFTDAFKIAIFPMKFLVGVPLAQKEFDALTDFTFNLGAGNSLESLQRNRGLASTTLLRVLNMGYYSAVPAEFEKFNQSGGVVIQALAKRRRDEANLWITGVYRANGKLIP